MNDIALSSLRVAAEIDAGKYKAGADQKVASDQAMVASAQAVGNAISQTDTKISQSGDGLTRLKRLYEDGFKSQERFEQGLRQIGKQLETGKTDIDGATRLLVGMNQKLGLSADVSEIAARGQTQLAAAVGMANAQIEAQTSALGQAAAAHAAVIAQARAEQAAENGRQAAAANQNKVNTVLGVRSTTSGAAQGSASVFEADFARLDQIAALRAAQIGQNFGADLEASLVGGVRKSARDAASVFEVELDRIDQIAALKAQQAGGYFQQDLNARFGIGRPTKSAQDSASVFENAPNQNGGFSLNRVGRMELQAAGVNSFQALASGMSPLRVAQMEGAQVVGALVQGQEGGVAGAFNAIKTGAAAAGTALTGVLGTTGLIATGFGAVALAAGAFYLATREKAKDLNTVLTQQKEIISSLGPAFAEMASQQQSKGPFENIGVGRLTLEQNLADARKAAQEQAKSALSEMRGSGGTFLSLIGSLPEGAQSALGRSQSSIEFDRIVDAASKGEMSINEARTALQRFGETHPDFAYTIGHFLQMSEGAAKAEREVGGLVGILDKFAKIRLPEKGILPKGAAGDELAALEFGAKYRMQQQFDVDKLSLDAKSPQELAAAARARATATVNSDETAGMRSTRIELAGKKALIEAEHQLKEAQDQRNRSLEQTLVSAKLDVDLVGKTTAEVEGLRMAAQLEAQVREEAARNHVAADEAEIARIRAKAAEYGKLRALEQARSTIFNQTQDIELQRAELGLVGQSTLAHDRAIASLKAEQEIRKLGIPLYGAEAEAIRKNTAELSNLAEAAAKAKIQQDLLFDIRQMGRSEADQSVASQLRSSGLPEDLDSDIAKVIRMRDEIGRMKDTWNEVFQTARDGIDGVVDALFSGGSIEDALKKAGQQLARTVFDMAVTNPLKNWLTGSNLNTIADLGIFGNGATSGRGGGFGGVLGNLLGAQKAVASMQVQAASVFINGSPLGGIPGIPGIPGLTNPANDNFTPTTTLTDLLTGGDVNSSQSNISQRISSPAGGFANVLGSTSSSLTGSMAQYASAIKAVESLGSGGYSALGPLLKNGNQALGAYQIMKSNLPSWSTEAFGSPMSASTFMSSPAAQDTIFNQQFGKLLGKYGNPQDAASAWFTGGPLSSGAGKMDILGTTGSQYVDKFNSALEKLGGTTQSLTGATSSAARGLTSFGGGLQQFGSTLSSFMASASGGGSSWFQGLMSMFGGAGGALNFMNGISPAATADILSGSWGLFAEGTENAPPGWAWVGEKGPELKKLRAGDVIRSNPRSVEMMKQAAGGGSNDNIKDLVRMLAPHLKTNTKIINLYDPSVVGDYLDGPAGEEKIMNVLRRNGR